MRAADCSENVFAFCQTTLATVICTVPAHGGKGWYHCNVTKLSTRFQKFRMFSLSPQHRIPQFSRPTLALSLPHPNPYTALYFYSLVGF